MTAPDLSGIEQLPPPDPRGWLALRYLPPDVQRAEDSTAVADRDNGSWRVRGFERLATETERILLEHLGYQLPERLITKVTYRSHSVRNRRWPALENQEV